MESVFLYVVSGVLYAGVSVRWLCRVFLSLLRETVTLSGRVVLLDTGIFWRVCCFSKVSWWLSGIWGRVSGVSARAVVAVEVAKPKRGFLFWGRVVIAVVEMMWVLE